jgi:hypothetical protein
MYGLVLSLFGAFLISVYSVDALRNEQVRAATVTGDVQAANILIYRQSVSKYLSTNPIVAGSVLDSSLTFPDGFVRNSAWRNVVADGELYVFSNAVVNPLVVSSAVSKLHGSILVGRKRADGWYQSAVGNHAFAGLPAQIPVGAIVLVGK